MSAMLASLANSQGLVAATWNWVLAGVLAVIVVILLIIRKKQA